MARRSPIKLRATIPRGWAERLGAELRRARKERGATVDDCSESSFYHRNTIMSWERGGNCRLLSFVLHCFTLGIKPSEVMRRAGL